MLRRSSRFLLRYLFESSLTSSRFLGITDQCAWESLSSLETICEITNGDIPWLRDLVWLPPVVLICASTASGQGPAPETAPPLFPGGGLISYNSIVTTRAPGIAGGVPSTARPTFSHEADFNFTWGFFRDFDLTVLIPIITTRFDITGKAVGGTGLGDSLVLVKYRIYR